MKKFLTTLLLFIGVNCGYSQVPCTFELIDTISPKKGYYLVYSDENNKRIGVFATNRRDAFSFRMENIDQYQLYYPSSVLERIIVLSKIYGYEDISDLKLEGVKTKLLKDCKDLRIYQVNSERGFVIWKLSKEAYSENSTNEQMRWPFSEQCLNVISPLSPNLRVDGLYETFIKQGIPLEE